MNGELISTLKDNWDVIANAPWAFASVTFLVVVVVWIIVSHLKANQIADYAQRISLRDDQISDYKQKLSGATPDQAQARIEFLENQLARLAPRLLSLEQISKICSLAQVAHGTVRVSYLNGTPDGLPLQQALAQAFENAGWIVSGTVMMGGEFSESGMDLIVYRDRPATEQALKALRSAGLAHEVTRRSPVVEDDPDIAIQISLVV